MYSPITGIGNGTAPVVNITWPFIDKNHVQARVNGIPVVASWTGASQITFASTVANGTPYDVIRSTPYSDPLVDFTDGSVLTEADLDLAMTQLRYVFEEARSLGMGGDTALRADLASTAGASLVKGSNSNFLQTDLNRLVGASAHGTLPTGSTNSIDVTKTAVAASDGTTQWYNVADRMYLQGTNPWNFGRNKYLGVHVQGSGVVASADVIHGYLWGEANATITNGQGLASHLRLDAGARVTNEFDYFRAVSATYDAAAGVTGQVVGVSIGAIGHNTKVTNAYGVDVQDLSAVTSAIAFRSQMNLGTGKWAFFSGGTANSALVGGLRLGGSAVPGEKLDVTGNANVSGTYKVNGAQVVAAKQTGTPAAATDLASAITLVNFLRTALQTHGLIA